MSADLTCKRCNGTRVYGHGKCWSCHGEGRRRPELHEWDALKAERDQAKEAVRNLDKTLRNAVKERGDALAERDRYHEALEFIANSPDWKLTWREAIAKSIDGRYRLCVERARAALDSDPDLAERTRKIRADE